MIVAGEEPVRLAAETLRPEGMGSRKNQMELRASAAAPGEPLTHFWSCCVGAGRANEGLRANWLEHLQLAVRNCGFRYVRFHGLFHDDMFVYRERDGVAVYNWQYVDELFDRLLDIGIRPFVELGFSPGDMASSQNVCFWWKGFSSPPKDLVQWAALVEAFLRHCIARYGEDEVRQWYFEVWNEPNLQYFFDGTRRQYFELYAVTARAVKGVDPLLRVGGPATCSFVADARFAGEKEDHSAHTVFHVKDLSSVTWKGVWIEAFLQFCHERQLPVDFISTHPYPTSFALDTSGEKDSRTRAADATRLDMQWLREALASSPYPDAEIHLTEWSSSPSSRDHTHDYLQAATYIVRTNLACTGLADSLSHWTFTDVFEEEGAGGSIFHGGFGMINFQGIVKPSFHAYRFLHALGDQRLATFEHGIVTRRSQDGRVRALAFHYPPEMPQAPMRSSPTRDDADRTLALGHPRTVEIELSDLPPHATFEVEVLDQDHGNALAVWQAMGSPDTPCRKQTAALRQAAMATDRRLVEADQHGRLRLQQTLRPWSLLMLRQL